ncbi:MAG: hypothetical protein KGQ60_07940 [Planctomycetes bacterium]|nr:hypothetical protein [Planctomycetota bacterium]
MSIDSSSYGDRMDDNDLSPELGRAVERVRAASSIVCPSEFFRTKILQRARQQERDRRSDRIVLQAVIALTACLLLLMFAASKLEAWGEDPFYRATWAGMQQRASEIAAERRIAMDASLCEAYLEWRSELAQRWRKSSASASSQP